MPKLSTRIKASGENITTYARGVVNIACIMVSDDAVNIATAPVTPSARHM